MRNFLKKFKEKQEIKSYNIEQSIQSSVHTFNLSNIVENDKILNLIHSYRQTFPVSRKSSIVGCWHSDYFLHHHEPDIIKELFLHIDKKVEEHYFLNTSFEPKLTSSWAIMYEENSYTEEHSHGISTVSGVYYPFVDGLPSPLVFSQSNLAIIPTSGMCVLFPGYARHHVPLIKEKCNRVALSFNYTAILKDIDSGSMAARPGNY